MRAPVSVSCSSSPGQIAPPKLRGSRREHSAPTRCSASRSRRWKPLGTQQLGPARRRCWTGTADGAGPGPRDASLSRATRAPTCHTTHPQLSARVTLRGRMSHVSPLEMTAWCTPTPWLHLASWELGCKSPAAPHLAFVQPGRAPHAPVVERPGGVPPPVQSRLSPPYHWRRSIASLSGRPAVRRTRAQGRPPLLSACNGLLRSPLRRSVSFRSPLADSRAATATDALTTQPATPPRAHHRGVSSHSRTLCRGKPAPPPTRRLALHRRQASLQGKGRGHVSVTPRSDFAHSPLRTTIATHPRRTDCA